jgi:exodeoxyribonuclease V alpha subunit
MPDTIHGVISYIKTSYHASGKVRFVLDSSMPCEHRQPDGAILCEALRSYVTDGATVKISGEWDGDILRCTAVDMAFLSDQATIKYLVTNCKGIGQKKAVELTNTYHEQIFELSREDLRAEIHRDFPRYPEKAILALLDATHAERKGLHELERELLSVKLPYDRIMDVYGEYGEGSVKQVKEHPYATAEHMDLPFDIMDAYAKKNGVWAYDKKRLDALCRHVLRRNENQGNTYMTAPELADQVSLLSEKSAFHIPVDPLLVSTSIHLLHGAVLDRTTAEVARDVTQDQERNVANCLMNLMSFPSDITIAEDDIEAVEDTLGIHYGEEQRQAFQCLPTGSVNILTGGPGTGKTTVIRGILAAYRRKHPEAIIKLAAPTGRAAKRLAESTGERTSTVHKLLDFKAYGDVLLHKTQASPVECDMLVIDESSMLDIELCDMLLSALKPGTRVLFVGDEDQLPSIGAGNVLHDMIASGVIPVWRLSENFRQGKSGIHDSATLIKQGRVPVHNGKDVFIYHAKDEEEGYRALCGLMDHYYDHDNPFATQLIEPSHKGTAGVYRMNQYVHGKVHGGGEDLDRRPMAGDKVMFTSTDYESGYVNGDIGILKHMDKDYIQFWDGNDITALPASAAQDLTLAYAYTIHKSQGSENEHVIIYLPEEMAHMMTRSLLYTSVTRAKKRVTIVYTGNALYRSVQNTRDVRRKTRLCRYLQEKVEKRKQPGR